MNPTILVIQHIAHERLGTLEGSFIKANCKIITVDASNPLTQWPDTNSIDGIVSMGGPMSVYRQNEYPFLKVEMGFLRKALYSNTPILGICLGAQLLAFALGARIEPSPNIELGWYELNLQSDAKTDPLLKGFRQREIVFQWHSDTYTLPDGAVRLAGSILCREQAFRYGKNAYGVQFHVEMTEAIVRAWMRTTNGKSELERLRGIIDPMEIRRQSRKHVGRLQELSSHLAEGFVDIVVEAGKDTPSRV